MVLGLIAAVCAAGVYPIMFLLYGDVAKTLVNYGKNKTNYSTISYGTSTLPNYNLSSSSFVYNVSTTTSHFTSNFTSKINDTCAELTEEEKDFDGNINKSINYYVLLGFITLILEYLAHVTWNTTSERQIKKMRYVS